MPIPFTCPHCGVSLSVDDQFAGQTGPCASCGQSVAIPKADFSSPPPLPKQNSGKQLALIIVPIAIVVVLGVVGLIWGLMIAGGDSSYESARAAARRMQCKNNLKQIAIAMQNYYDVYNSFPAAYVPGKNRKPMHSWRVAILPFLEQQNLYRQYDFNEPWDSPKNRQLHRRMPEVYRCPTDDESGEFSTSYMVVVGKNTMFEPGRWLSMGAVTDGTSNTIAVVEVVGAKTNWMAPVDLDLDTLKMQINASRDGRNISSNHVKIVNVAFVDGSVHSLKESISAETLRKLLIRNDGETISEEDF